jgi:hypothetical protein
VLAKSDPTAGPYQQHSVVLVPAGWPGVKVERFLSVYVSFHFDVVQSQNP